MMITDMNQEIKNIYTDDYPYWLKTRCKYKPSMPVGILASLQPSKSSVEHEYLNSPICNFLNASIALNKELSPIDFKIFAIVYYKRSATEYYKSIDSDWYNVKMAADKYDVNVSKVYRVAHNFALKCYNEAIGTLNMNEKLKTMLIKQDFTFA